MRVFFFACLSLASVLAIACGDDSSPSPDGGLDAAVRDASMVDGHMPPADAGPPRPVRIETDDGPVIGYVDPGSPVAVFRGIPYAAPPLGDLRWRPPAPAVPWTEPLEATSSGPACPQQDVRLVDRRLGLDEDCLVLNVWRPADDSVTDLPVLVFIHGGAFLTGSTNYPVYDGATIAEEGVVVVSMNYRLGLLGFLAHADLAAEDTEWPTTGNYGLLDQLAALRWVQREIARFGGDPSRVMIFGESAGSMSVCALLGTPKAGGLFHAAVMESGPCLSPHQTLDRGEGEAQAAMFSTRLGCDGAADELACLRSKAVEEILAVETGTLVNFDAKQRPGPVIDGRLLVASPRERAASGEAIDVPVIIGFNSNEASILVMGAGVTTEEELDQTLVQISAGVADVDALRAMYTSAEFGDPAGAATVAVTDALFRCPGRGSAHALASTGRATYAYHFSHVTNLGDLTGLGSFHGSELLLLFRDGTLRPEDALVRDRMLAHWIALAAGGDPGAHEGLAWPAFDASETHLVLADPASTAMPWPETARCDALDALYPGGI